MRNNVKIIYTKNVKTTKENYLKSIQSYCCTPPPPPPNDQGFPKLFYREIRMKIKEFNNFIATELSRNKELRFTLLKIKGPKGCFCVWEPC